MQGSSNKLVAALVFWGGLAFILALSWGVHAYADRADQNLHCYFELAYGDSLYKLDDLPWWNFLLPLRDFRGIWGPTGLLLVFNLEKLIGVTTTFHCLQALLVAVGYVLSWSVFRCRIFSFTFGLLLGLSTFNYHVYSCPGSVIMMPLMIFLMLFAYCQYRLLLEPARARWWGPLSVLSCVLFALCYEGWLDYVVFAWVAYPVLAWHFRRQGDTTRCRLSLLLLGLVTVVAGAYIAIKILAGLDGLHPRGGEADLICTYRMKYPYLMIEDMFSSFVTFFFTAITTYVPPQLFVFSQSSWKYGPTAVVALQEGYHPSHTHLVHYNHLFLWRFYAGFALCAFLICYTKVLQRLKQTPTPIILAAFLFLTATLLGSPTHMLIKWRPMHAAPFLGYQCFLAVMGWTLFLSLLAHYVVQKWSYRWAAIFLVLLWCNTLYCALARPALLSHMSTESGLGAYPNPWKNIRE